MFTLISPEKVSLTVTVLFLFVILTAAPLCGLARRRHKWGPALILTGTAIAAVVAAAFICRAFIKLFGNALFGLIRSVVDQELLDWLALMPTGENVIRATLGIASALLIFLPVFILVYVLMRVIAGVLIRVIGGPWDGKHHLDGFLIGLGNGALLGLILLIPLCSMITTTSGTAQTFFKTGVFETATVRDMMQDTDPKDIEAYAVKLSENVTVKVVDTIAARPVRNIIDHTKISLPAAEEGEADKVIRFSLNDSVNGLTEMAGQAVVTVDKLLEYTETHKLTDEQKASVDKTMDCLFSFDWLTQAGAELISEVSSCWLQKQDCLTLQYPEVNEMLVPTMDTALEVLSGETRDTLKADLTTVKELLYLLCDTNLLLDDQTYDSVMEKVWGEGLMDDLMDVIDRNGHLWPMTQEFKSLGFRVLSRVLSLDELENGTYDDALDQITPVLQSVLDKKPEEREPEIRDAVQTAFAKYDINVPEDLAVSMAEEVISTYGGDGSITSEELREFLKAHYDVVDEFKEQNPDVKLPEGLDTP